MGSIGNVCFTKLGKWRHSKILLALGDIWQSSGSHLQPYKQCRLNYQQLCRDLVTATNAGMKDCRTISSRDINQYRQRIIDLLWGNGHSISRCYSSGIHGDDAIQPAPPCISWKKSPRKVYGESIVDDFWWMQDPAYSKEFKIYIEQENRFTNKSLGRSLPFQKKLAEQMRHFDMRPQQCDPFSIMSDSYRYWREMQEDGSYVYFRKSVDKDHCVQHILDTADLLKKYNYPMDSIVSDAKVSPCHQYAACMVENPSSNTDTYTTHIIRMTSWGAEYADIIPGIVRFEFGSGSAVFYTKPSAEESLRATQVWRHLIGQTTCHDSLVYQEHDDRFFVDLYPTQDGRYINIITSTMQTMTEVWLIDAHNPLTMAIPRLVWRRQDGLEYFVEHHEGHLFILANFGEGWQVYKVPTEAIPFNPASAAMLGLFSNNFDKVGGFEVVDDFCIVSVVSWQEGIKLAVKRLKDLGEKHHEIKLGSQFCNITHVPSADPKSDHFCFCLSSPTQPPVYYSYHPRTSSILAWPSRQEGHNGSNEFTCARMQSVSKDGTHVPITLFQRHDLQLDGNNPLLVTVYGAYGSDVEMDYSPERSVLLKRGWVIAYCHVRGGGELGRKWSQDGRQLKKHHTFEDFCSCISHLHKNKYSQPKLTAAYGISAGGLTVAVLCNQSPHLIRGAILKVPFVDVLTTMLDSTLALTTQDYDEYGDPKEDHITFNTIKEYCPYFNIQNQHYPSMYVITSLTDRRVPPWGPVKYVAKLRRMMQGIKASDNSDNNQLLLQVDQDGGHFGSMDSEAQWTQAAKEWTFLYKVLDLPLR